MSLLSRLFGRSVQGSSVDAVERGGAVAGASPTAVVGAVELLAAMTNARNDVVERVREVNELTEKEVMSAAQNIAAAVARASDQMRDLKGVLEQFDGAGAGGVARAISAQADTVERHVADMVSQAKSQVAAVSRAQVQAAEMHKASLAIDDMAGEARILALNSRVEAAKLGGQNRAFTVVADEMRRLSQAVAQTNTMVRELSERLGSVLSAVAEQARATCAGLEAFAAASQNSISDVKREVGEFQTVVRDVVSASDESIAFIVNSSNEALSHLQFQDVVAQGLLRIDARIYDLQVEAATSLGEPEAAAGLAAAVHQEIGGDKKLVNNTAGEVMLF